MNWNNCHMNWVQTPCKSDIFFPHFYALSHTQAWAQMPFSLHPLLEELSWVLTSSQKKVLTLASIRWGCSLETQLGQCRKLDSTPCNSMLVYSGDRVRGGWGGTSGMLPASGAFCHYDNRWRAGIWFVYQLKKYLFVYLHIDSKHTVYVYPDR